MTRIFRIGARGSALSIAQTRTFAERLGEALGFSHADHDHRLPFTPITTSGDQITDRRLLDAGSKGLFTKELDEALLEGRIDLAVHSLKDLPTALPEGVALACVPTRLDPRDAFICRDVAILEELPPRAVVGTASLRRQAQVLFARPDLRVETLRGNVDTRLRKIDAGEVDATFLAFAGLLRLGLESRARSLAHVEAMPPAACQGALAVTARADDDEMLGALAALADESATVETAAERAFLAALDGSCRTPIAALGRLDDEGLSFIGETLTPDGSTRWRRVERIAREADMVEAARALGARLGRDIKEEAGEALVTD